MLVCGIYHGVAQRYDLLAGTMVAAVAATVAASAATAVFLEDEELVALLEDMVRKIVVFKEVLKV